MIYLMYIIKLFSYNFINLLYYSIKIKVICFVNKVDKNQFVFYILSDQISHLNSSKLSYQNC